MDAIIEVIVGHEKEYSLIPYTTPIRLIVHQSTVDRLTLGDMLSFIERGHYELLRGSHDLGKILALEGIGVHATTGFRDGVNLVAGNGRGVMNGIAEQGVVSLTFGHDGLMQVVFRLL